MEIQVNRLSYALSLLEPAVPSKPTLPVLKNVRLGEGRVVATDLEVAILAHLPEAEEALCLPYDGARRFLDTTPGHLTAHITLEGKQVVITAGSARASFEVPAVEDYPPIPSHKLEHEAAVDGDGLVRALTAVLPCVATKDTRPVLTAVCLTLGESPEAAGADGFRLAWEKVPGRLPGEGQLLIPARAVVVLTHLWRHAPKPPTLPGGEGPAHLARARRLIRLEYSQDKFRVSFGEVAMLAQLVQGTFPKYTQLIPTGGTPVSFLAEDLMRALQGVEKLAKKGSGIVRLRWGGERLRVEVRVVEVGSQSTEMPARCEGEGKIAFNISYLRDYLKGKEGMVTLSTTSPQEPGLWVYRGVPHFTLMPMFITWEDGPSGRTPAGPVRDAPVQEPPIDVIPSEATEAPQGPPAQEAVPERRRSRKR